ncbi:MAG TPA: GNAT family N-acetyltransferase [Polyangiaceae bacterium]|nr:GNAT family N-acetyltransferase [Polyangiaceae bacterium]
MQPTNSSAVRVRRAEPRDLKAVLRLLKELDAFHVGLEPRMFRKFTGPARSEPWLLERFTQPDEVCFVAQRDKNIVGFVWAKAQPAPPLPVFVPERHLLIADLIVTEAQRRAGIGQKLLSRALAWGKRRGLTRVQLSAFTENRAACALYEKLGFRPLSLVLQGDIEALQTGLSHAPGHLSSQRSSNLYPDDGTDRMAGRARPAISDPALEK